MVSAVILVSIIIPVYNVEKYLRRCLNSMVHQTLQNIEIIVVNDGSTDGSQDIIDDFVHNYPGKVFSHQKINGGQASARNFGIELARGVFIGFIDGDDYARLDMFEKMYNQAKERNADLIICDFDFVDEYENLISTYKSTGYTDISMDDKCYAHRYAATNPWNKLYHRDLFFITGIRFPHGWFEDYAVTPLLIENASKISYIAESLIFYVQRKDSSMSQAFKNGFTEKNFDILTMTDVIVQNRAQFEPVNFNFFMDQIAPIHTFTRFVLSILRIEDKKYRADVIKRWGKKLNRIVPGWYRSTAVKNKLRSMPLVRRMGMRVVILSFRFSLPGVINCISYNF